MRRYRWGNQYELKRSIFLAVRDALYSPAHPDSKRQARRKARDLARYGARTLKECNQITCHPVSRLSKRQEIKRMREVLRLERLETARTVAKRLLGRRHAA